LRPLFVFSETVLRADYEVFRLVEFFAATKKGKKQIPHPAKKKRGIRDDILETLLEEGAACCAPTMRRMSLSRLEKYF
jgi:hypothetical protein